MPAQAGIRWLLFGICWMGVAWADDLPEVETRTASPVSHPAYYVEPAAEESILPVKSPPSTLLQFNQRLEALQEEVQQLRGTVEELQNQVRQLSQRPVASAPLPTEATLSPEKQLYQTASQQLKEKQYDAAKLSLQKLISDYPTGEYTANGYYWLGEVCFIQGNLPEAMQAFSSVIQSFPQHAKVADSLLKLGYIASAESHASKAKQYFEQVVRQYPGSSAARLAEARLQAMR
jgi:tol-pal system protein YbgF